MRNCGFLRKVFCLLALILPLITPGQVQLHIAENRTLTYPEIIEAYKKIQETYPRRSSLRIAGKTDIGKPLHEFIIRPANDVSNPVTIMINNGIHPGEPDGIDATILFAREVLSNPNLYPDILFVIIPVYNVDGANLQTCCARANQNGPVNQGFRANGRNLDLNRDFIKCDARNTLGFIDIFQKRQPHIFIDNHVSNGADYQYTMTLITSQHNKLGPVLGPFVNNIAAPAIYADMKRKGHEMIPYVNTIDRIPDSGLVGFLETPRFSTGYTALFSCIGFVPETHMLKPFKERVQATLELMRSIAGYAQANQLLLKETKTKAQNEVRLRKSLPLSWAMDTTLFSAINFNGYEAEYITSEVSGLKRLSYNREKPYSRNIKFYNSYKEQLTAEKPVAYVIPQAWHQVIGLLKRNMVEVAELKRDTQLLLTADFIRNYETSKRPYEGHYLHYNVETEPLQVDIKLFAGDAIIYTDQPNVRFIMETLEARATDSYFAWGFFDSVLQQKEYFSDYVFEDTATELLKNNPVLKQQLETRKKNDPAFAKNGDAQLDFIYRNSKYYENSHNRYPVYKAYSPIPAHLINRK